MMNIPLAPPDITEMETNGVVEALRSGWITTGPGDEVIVPAYTYTATASVVYHVGA